MSDPTATDEAGMRTTDPMSPSIPDILLASLSALAAAGDLITTGPTGTNAGDLVIGLALRGESRPRVL